MKLSLYDFGNYLKEKGEIKKGTIHFTGDPLPMRGPRKYKRAWFTSGDNNSVHFGVFYSLFNDHLSDSSTARPPHGTIATGKITGIRGRVKVDFSGEPKIWVTDYTANFLCPGVYGYSEYVRKYKVGELL